MRKYDPLNQEDAASQWKLRSSLEDIEDFMASSLYKDFISMLDNQDAFLCEMLLDPEQRYSGRDYDKVRGGRQNIDDMRKVFQIMLEDKKLEVKQREESNG